MTNLEKLRGWIDPLVADIQTAGTEADLRLLRVRLTNGKQAILAILFDRGDFCLFIQSEDSEVRREIVDALGDPNFLCNSAFNRMVEVDSPTSVPMITL